MVQPPRCCWRGTLPIHSVSDKCLTLLDAYAEQVLAYGSNLQLAVLAAQADPSCCLANTLAGAVCLAAEKKCPRLPPPDPPSSTFLKRAQEQMAAGQCTLYEQAHLECILALAAGDVALILEKHLSLLQDWPQDLVTLKRAQTLAFYVGQQDLMLRLAQMVEKANARSPFFHGCLAFALLEAGRVTEAEAAARAGLALREDDPWAQHALCHVYHHRCQFEEAVRFMLQRVHQWQHCCPFMYIHNWWHLALCYVDMGRPQAALAVFDQHIWKDEWRDQGSTEDCSNGLGLLLRLELRGHGAEVHARLPALTDRIQNEGLWHVELLLDVLACWALPRCGRDAGGRQLLAKMAALAEKQKGPRRDALQAGWLRLAEAVSRYAAGDMDEAADGLLATDWKSLKVIGASDEQLDVFQELLCSVLLAAGRCHAALRLLQERARERDRVPFTHHLLARCRRMCGDEKGAKEAHARASELEAAYSV
ncbi:Tetratricopeptide repeat like superfamily protein [Klebsormidium nitens]|uniref:Tetratricopeptide repeat protein 38 n=1 Tax=Klebsormidium nitens TaxID=105231 RepID=A0A1Y1IR29_KLENI|nr:Tetratricopeptide repeat like superfamily protein [Klebsormidium nitens]|eukprot:GAQ91087.1 Tetratricopeptide repeat like superfamily protein [Klebsormidium nitens]